ncbi:putative phytol/farnesol kinase [Helianthus anomalus]
MLLPLAGDLCALALTSCYALGLLRLFEETAKRGVFKQVLYYSIEETFQVKVIILFGLGYQKLNRKLLHITFGLGFMLFWPLFSSGIQGAAMAALVPGVNIAKVLLIGLGIVKDEATVKSMSRFGDYRELLKGPMYYAITITLCCAIYWRTSPVAIAGICNLCAGDGIADIIGRRFGKKKIPYNKDKSFAGSIAMATAGFTVSVGYMYYFSMFGYVSTSFKIVLGFLVVSLVSALVESHPICAKVDDNLLVPLASVLLGTLVFA